ncbi:hypothetical protein SDC9_178669 [bioreactor metagenome]|uniref:Uncharacterized protein n=1 Tax=bioreactor metagenome TaxID=1076179 RepID=A0A645GWK7_9ZZZZ
MLALSLNPTYLSSSLEAPTSIPCCSNTLLHSNPVIKFISFSTKPLETAPESLPPCPKSRNIFIIIPPLIISMQLSMTLTLIIQKKWTTNY